MNVTVSPYGVHHFVDANRIGTLCGIDLTETPWRRTWPVWEEEAHWPYQDVCRSCQAVRYRQTVDAH